MAAVSIQPTLALTRGTSGTSPVLDVSGNTAPLRLTLDVTAIANSRSRADSLLEVSIEDSPDGAGEWRTIHRFRGHTTKAMGPGVASQDVTIGAFHPFVRARYALRSFSTSGDPSATFSVTGNAPTSA